MASRCGSWNQTAAWQPKDSKIHAGLGAFRKKPGEPRPDSRLRRDQMSAAPRPNFLSCAAQNGRLRREAMSAAP
jgi:hypothetical protein